ncbi:MAG: cysteine--tRNA ligase [Flavobacteriales bacterium]
MKRYETHPLQLYDSLRGRKERFIPIESDHVGLYVCGPTVYSPVHLGNVRTFISFDLIYRYLSHLGYSVCYVRNITDVGHLERDADEGADKITKKARLEQIAPMQVAQRYTLDLHQVLQRFNNTAPDMEPTATGHIPEQIETVEKLLANGLAYAVNGSVYFDVKKYDETNRYGELSRRSIDELIANSRDLQGTTEKKNPQDFALWKKASPQRIMRWKSPWGEGFPGWHLECTTMSTKYLGVPFDIHGGGMDLKFPHHECEIAQAKGAYGKAPANYWLHANMLTLNGQKMSKSTGNTVLPKDLINGTNPFFKSGFHPLVIRFFMMQAHYRSVLDLSDEAIRGAEKGYFKLMNAYKALRNATSAQKSDFDVRGWVGEAYEAMSDDFNTPVLIAKLFEAVHWANQIKAGSASLREADLHLLREKFHTFTFEILGLQPIESEGNFNKLSEVVNVLIEMRAEARADKNWAFSDQIRDRLAAIGIRLQDGADGTRFTLES